MDWRFLEDLWERLKSGHREAIRLDQEAAFERSRHDREADRKRKREDQDADARFTVLTLSRESRRQFQQLFADAAQAAQPAYARAVREAEAAHDALDDARRRALVLPDGRRAYFDANGRLFLEDGGEITDSAERDAARRARDLSPGATSYEDYQENVGKANEANERLEGISETLPKIARVAGAG